MMKTICKWLILTLCLIELCHCDLAGGSGGAYLEATEEKDKWASGILPMLIFHFLIIKYSIIILSNQISH